MSILGKPQQKFSVGSIVMWWRLNLAGETPKRPCIGEILGVQYSDDKKEYVYTCQDFTHLYQTRDIPEHRLHAKIGPTEENPFLLHDDPYKDMRPKLDSRMQNKYLLNINYDTNMQQNKVNEAIDHLSEKQCETLLKDHGITVYNLPLEGARNMVKCLYNDNRIDLRTIL